MTIEEAAFAIILHAGNARAEAYAAIEKARQAEFAEAEERLGRAREELRAAHQVQTDLIQKEAAGQGVPPSLLLIHAQDHLMTASAELSLAEQMVALCRRLAALEGRLGGARADG
ncbi:MAG: PTS lactose/cellobiose transporter subunit IIA [Bacillota bacterium]